MTTTAAHNAHDNTPERVLFVVFELSDKTRKLGFTTGHGEKPRERTRRACSKKSHTPKDVVVYLGPPR